MAKLNKQRIANTKTKLQTMINPKPTTQNDQLYLRMIPRYDYALAMAPLPSSASNPAMALSLGLKVTLNGLISEYAGDEP